MPNIINKMGGRMRNVWAVLVCGVWAGTAAAQVSLPNVFSDHAVLQRGGPVAIWGKASPAERVTVRFAGQVKTATAGADGRWRLALDPLQPGGPYELVASGAQNEVRREDILVGDVWLCAGQSNMGTSMADTQWWMSRCPGANVPGVRLLALGGNGGYGQAEPQEDIPDTWYPCAPATAFRFSAIGFFFGTRLHAQIGVPVGLIKCSSWGVPAEQYVPVDALRQSERFSPLVAKRDADAAAFQQKSAERDAAHAARLKVYEEHVANFTRALVEHDVGLTEHWEDPATDVSAWGTVRLPGNWEATDLNGQGGAFWLRKETSVVEAWLGRALRLHLGGCDDNAATVYFNGREIGRSGADADATGYGVPAGLARAGMNTIVVRLVDSGGAPNCLGGLEFLMYLTPADGGTGDERLPLPGDWRYRAGYTVPRPSLPPQAPSAPRSPAAQGAPGCLYNGMLAPLAGYGITGVLWYQGENNADRAKDYETLFPLLIRSWRQAWGAEIAFLWVQLPNYLGNGKPKDSAEPLAGAPPADFPLGWARIREAQLKALALPRTAMAVTIDCGESWNIHPNNKKTVADRLLVAAMGSVYDSGQPYSGPIYDTMHVEDAKIRLRFRHVGGGLVAQDGPLRAFAVAGADRVFVWADAVIENDTVIVSSDRVRQPVAVRYAFCAAPPGANLYNAAGLPASPFRTDDWENE